MSGKSYLGYRNAIPMGGTLGQCLICKKRTELTQHHLKELGKNENGIYHKLGLCNDCQFGMKNMLTLWKHLDLILKNRTYS